jgi:hypothetical protein
MLRLASRPLSLSLAATLTLSCGTGDHEFDTWRLTELGCGDGWDSMSLELHRSEPLPLGAFAMGPWWMTFVFSINEDYVEYHEARLTELGIARLEAAELELDPTALRAAGTTGIGDGDGDPGEDPPSCSATFEGPGEPIVIRWPTANLLEWHGQVPAAASGVLGTLAQWDKHIHDLTCSETDEIDDCGGIPYDPCTHGYALETSCEDPSVSFAVWEEPGYVLSCQTSGEARAADFDGDGLEDHIRANNVHLTREGAAETHEILVTGGIRGGSVGDLDGDGTPDFAGWSTTGSNDSVTSSWIAWNGTFASDPEFEHTVPGVNGSTYAVDLDHDGHSELLRFDEVANDIGVWSWPNLSVESERIGALPVNETKRLLALPDFDEDGLVEIVTWPQRIGTDDTAEIELFDWDGEGAFVQRGETLVVEVEGDAEDLVRLVTWPGGMGVGITRAGSCDRCHIIEVRSLTSSGIGDVRHSVVINGSQYDAMNFDFFDVDRDGWDDLITHERSTGAPTLIRLRPYGADGFDEVIDLGYAGRENVVVLEGSGSIPDRILTSVGALGIQACD